MGKRRHRINNQIWQGKGIYCKMNKRSAVVLIECCMAVQCFIGGWRMKALMSRIALCVPYVFV